VPPAGLASLRKEPRRYVNATLHEGETVYTDVAVRLRGSAGSFRNVDDKAGLSLNFTRHEASSPFHGLRKFHLYNSVQDPSYFSEWLCGDLFRAAGVPAPRVAHAVVELNGRKLGLYTLVEGADRLFLSRYFQNTRGNLYGQSGGCEITDPIERMEGDGPLDRAELKRLAAAVQDPDPVRRLERMRRTLDLDRFLAFMALEVLFSHWDGYTFARHNYRLYHDRDTDRVVFLPHDLDQMMGDPNVPILPNVNGLVAQAVLKTPETRRLYRERFGHIFTNLFQVSVLTNRLNQAAARLLPAVREYNKELARDVENHVAGLRSRIVNRAQGIERQLRLPEPRPLRFEQGVARPGGWRKHDEPGSARLDQVKAADGTPALWISTARDTVASWRARVLLEEGRYRFEGRARAAGVAPTRDDRKGAGAGLRISGSEQPRRNELAGDAPWQTLAYEFSAGPLEEVELVCELRATKGEVWFDLASLRLVRLR
jgi:hypothetical protein